VQFSSRDLYSSLKAAAAGEVGSPVQKLLLLCFHYNPVTGRYSPTILGMLRMMSAATVLGVCALIGNSLRKPRAP
jgi:protein SCO1/2